MKQTNNKVDNRGDDNADNRAGRDGGVDKSVACPLLPLKNIPVVFENDVCIVFNKPAGLPVQGGKGVRVSLDSLLVGAYSPRPFLVHRLDKDTSGLILVARNQKAAVYFSGLFASRTVLKQYLAVCQGRPRENSGVIRLSLYIKGEKRQSETAYTVLKGNGEFSLLCLELGTGRMHQIRRHLAGIGCPVLGDDKYGNFSLNKSLRKTRRLRRLLLHASRLVIPASPPVDISAPPPDYFEGFVTAAADMTDAPGKKGFTREDSMSKG
ncbi:MAG: RNA pseudouridine synthase [Treponema sp.]|jgi:23S rRNA pseudouridine955/2504/2580 synthase|nr:RNA pseudouridine synthase [Treponema sp.]